MSIEISCPSGLKFAARNMKVRELETLAKAAQANAADGGLSAILSSCWEELVDPGPAYPALVHGHRPDWSRMLDGDVVVALTRLREASMGPHAEVRKIRCEYCGRPPSRPLEFDLREWEEIPYPETTIQAFAAGLPLETTKPSGGIVKFRPQILGQHAALAAAKKRYQRRLQDQKSPDAQAALKPADWDLLVRQVVFVEELGERSKDPLTLIEWATNLELKDFYFLRDHFSAQEGGLETKIKFTCEHVTCGWDQERDVPLDGEFFRPALRRERPEGSPAEG